MSAIRIWSYASPLGELGLASDASGRVTAVSFEGADADFGRRVRPMRPDVTVEAGHPEPRIEEQLDAYFSGRRDALGRIAWSVEGDGFHQRVWRALAEIPAASTISYGEMARRAGEPGGAQAAGVALNRNPIPLILPCHRVIGADGALVGFGGGVERKRWLLAHEGALLL